MKTNAAVAYPEEPGFRYETLDIDAPQSHEILVRIKGVGICHTDLLFRSGATGYPLPAVFGHEGSGVVEAIGDDVTKARVGDGVLLTFRSCGACDRCNDQDPAYCRAMPVLNYTGNRDDGSSALSNGKGPVTSNFFGQSSFASLALTYERNVVVVDDDLPIELLGPLSCGIQTGVGSVLRSLDAKPGSSILICGGGSVGLSAVMGAKIRDCETIVVLEPLATRRDLAIELGATHCIDPSDAESISSAVKTILPMGVDNAIDTTGLPTVQAECLLSMGSKATLGLVCASPPDTRPPGDLNTLIMLGQSLKGIVEGDSDPDTFLPELMDLYRKGRLPIEKLIKTFKLSEINQAIEEQHRGDCVKAVLLPDA